MNVIAFRLEFRWIRFFLQVIDQAVRFLVNHYVLIVFTRDTVKTFDRMLQVIVLSLLDYCLRQSVKYLHYIIFPSDVAKLVFPAPS